MCLILVAHKIVPKSPLLVLANRDEFYARPTAAVTSWPECPKMIAGRDLVAGGTWLGLAEGGRWSGVTNVRERLRDGPSERSRGWLVRDYLQGNDTPEVTLARLAGSSERYAGYNLLAGDQNGLWSYTNRERSPRMLLPGLYGLSNHRLDTPWPKVVAAKAAFGEVLKSSSPDVEELFALMTSTVTAPDKSLPDTGIPLEWERALSAIFIRTPDYGTRSTTLIRVGPDGEGELIERSYSGDPSSWTETRHLLASTI